MQSVTLTGAHINVYINNQLFKTVQSLTLDVDYAEEPFYGIDCPWPQEIAGGKMRVVGSVRGLRVKNSGGLQGSNMRPLFTDLAASPYITIRIQDRSTTEDIALIMGAKVKKESHVMGVRGSYKLNFDFEGQLILWALDRS